MTPSRLTLAAQFRPDYGPGIGVLKVKPTDAFIKEVEQQLKFSASVTDTRRSSPK